MLLLFLIAPGPFLEVTKAQCGVEERETIMPPALEPWDYFGNALAVSGDVAVVGAHGNDDLGREAGAAFILRFTGGSWTQEARLLAPGGTDVDTFGLAVDADGDWVVIGAPRHDDTGAVFVYRWDGAEWGLHAELHASDGQPFDAFGVSVSIVGDLIFVGADAADDLVDDAGAVYVFRREGGAWAQEAKLSTGLADRTRFGRAIDAVADGVVIGSWIESGTGPRWGVVEVYRHTVNGWVVEATLRPSDPVENDGFGGSISLDGAKVLIGARGAGAAYVFRRDAGVWREDSKLTPGVQNPGVLFGDSVDLEDNLAVIGAPGSSTSAGAAFAFRKYGPSWALIESFAPSNGSDRDDFGAAVGVRGDAALIGAPRHDESGENAGAVFGFTIGDRLWLEVTADCPSGGVGVASWICATPSGAVALFFARESGSITIPTGRRCAGATLDLAFSSLQLVGSNLPSDPNGAGQHVIILPAAACGGRLQLIDLETCAVSNVARIE
ncbi:MAG: FG-GAP repeat protein [Phycisphaerales bacterium]